MRGLSVLAARDRAAARPAAGPAVAGLGYATAWAAGLVIGPPSLSVTTPSAEVVRAITGHQGPVIAQLVLAEGVAALALAAVVLALGRAARGRGARRLTTRIEVTGLAALDCR